MRSFVLIVFALPVLLMAQENPTPNNSARNTERPLLGFYSDFSVQMPSADMAVRYGKYNGMGFGFWRKSASLWTLGGVFRAYFGGDVKEPNLLGSMVGPSGSPIDQNGILHVVRSYMRGYHTQLQLGRLIPLNGNLHSGIHLQAGYGFLQHKIKFSYDERALPQLNVPYQYGYDRLSNGWTVSFSATAQHVNLNNGISFFGGMEWVQGYTYNRRSFDIPNGTRETALRTDACLSIKGGLLVPIFRKKKSDEEFFQ